MGLSAIFFQIALKPMRLHILIFLICLFVCLYFFMLFGERSEPLSRVFNDQPRGIYIYMVESVRTYVSNTHAHVRMSVCY